MASRNSTRAQQDAEELEMLLEQEKPEGQEEKPETLVEETPATKEEESYKKRYGDLRRHMQTKEKEWEDRFKALEQAQTGVVAPPKSNEDLEQWISANPDVAGIVALLAKRQAEEILGETKSEVEALTKLRRDSSKEQAELQILKVHPDFLEIRDADEFHTWAEEQPKWIQDSIYEETSEAKSIIRALDLYKMDKGMTKEDKKREAKEAVALVKTPRKGTVNEDAGEYTFSESQVQKMSAREYNEKEEEINKAMRSGKFLYDVSGALR